MKQNGSNVLVLNDFHLPEVPGPHYRLVRMTGKQKGVSYYLRGKRIVIGRGLNCDIVLKDDKASREHAEIKRVGSSFYITDLGAQNGVVINDQKVKQRILTEADLILIGESVFKFDRVEVHQIPDEKRGSEKQDKQTRSRKKPLVYIIVFLLVVIFLADEGSDKQKKNIKSQYDVNVDTTDEIARRILKRDAQENREIAKKLESIFQRGLRELREKNYFRAIEEFNHALVISPENSAASHYLSVAEKGLANEIESNFLSAIKDKEALRFEKAINSYCNIIRLLQNYPDDEDYLRAQKHLRDLEVLMGREENEIKCF